MKSCVFITIKKIFISISKLNYKISISFGNFFISNDNDEEVIKISYIYYLIKFQKSQIKALFARDSKVNIMNFGYIKKQDFII